MPEFIKLKIRYIEKIVLHKFFLPAIYRLYKNRPVQEELVLFADAKNNKVPFSMQAMYDAMQEKGYRVENWCVDFDRLVLFEKLKYLCQFMKRYAKAKYVFICDYFLPIASCKKRKETKVIQLWHACGMLKKFGYDAIDDLGNSAYIQINNNIDLWTVSADCCVPVYEHATQLYGGQIQALGVPRTDIYYSEQYRQSCKVNFYQKYPDLLNKKIILWAPTFRSNAKTAELAGLQEINQLQKELKEDWHILIKIHPHLLHKNQVNNCEIPIEQLYPVVDLLITDYSSVIFDYSLFQKPFLIYVPDYETYMNQRGTYIDMETRLPCKVAKNYFELKDAICCNEITVADVTDFKERYMQRCNGDTIQQLISILGDWEYGNKVKS